MYEANNTANEEVKTTNPQESQVVNDKPKKKFRFNWKKFVGYFFLGILVLGIGYLGYRFYEFKPYRVIVSNVTSRSATISWVTDSAEPGMVVYKEGNTILPIWISKYGMGNGYDDRDYSNAELEAANKTRENIAESGDITADDIETEIVVTGLGTYWSHHVTIRNLNPETEYEFMVGDGLVFEKAETVETETVTLLTFVEEEEIEIPSPSYGIIKYYGNSSYTVPVDTMVYAVLREEFTGITSETISSTTSESGGWYLDLSNAYTQDGTRFFDAISEHEAVNIVLNLTIENEWLGRWSKEINYGNSSPAEEIILYDINDEDYVNEDEDLIYEGLSFVEEDFKKLSFTSIIYASDCSLSDYKTTTNGKTVYDYTGFSRCIQSSSSGTATQLTVSQAVQAAALNGKAAKELKDADPEQSAYLSVRESEILEAVDKVKQKDGSTNNDIITIYSTPTIDNPNYKNYTDNADDDLYGECYGNVCYPEIFKEALTCGNLDYTSCRCICSNESDNISHGQVCACTDKGEIDRNQFKDEGDIPAPYSEENGEELGLCWNNKLKTTNTDKSCYSYVNKCWYSEGYVTTDGLLCYNREDIEDEMLGDWIQEGTKEEWEGYYTEFLSEELGVCDWTNKRGVYKWRKSSKGTVTEQECVGGEIGNNLVKGVCCNYVWNPNAETCSDGVKENSNAHDITTCEQKTEDGYGCVFTKSTVGQYRYIWTYLGHNEDLPLISSRKTPSSCEEGNSPEKMMCCSISDNYFGESFIWISESTCDAGGYAKHPEYSSIQSCSAQNNDNSVLTGTTVSGYTCYFITEEDGTHTYVWDKFYYTDETTLESLFGYTGIKGCIWGGASSKDDCEERNNPDYHYRGPVTENKSLTETGCYENSETGIHLVAFEDDIVYICKNNNWTRAGWQQSDAEKPVANGSCKGYNSWDRTIIDGKLYECEGNVWEYMADKPINEYALKVKTDEENNYTCSGDGGYEKCLCSYTSQGWTHEELINPGETCPASESASVLGVNTKTEVLAQSTNTGKYILDTETGIIQGFKPGLYSFEYNGDTYMVNVSEEDYEANGGNFVIYLDKNGDGEIDEATEALTDEAVILTLTAKTEGFTYSLKEGFNFVSFPFVISEGDVKMAFELLELLNYKYDNAFYSISKYDSGKWTIVGSNGGTYDQNDFQLIPGQGYVLKTKWDINITLYGNEVTYDSSIDSAPIRFTPGWNLVGLYGTNVKSYTAESILADITNYEPVDFTAVNVSRWVESRALYEALQRDTDGTVYGLDFPIELKKSYFIKVTDGEGNWEPGIQ